MREVEIKNAIISAARITRDDHGLLSAWLDLDYGGTCQGFGGFSLYLPKSFTHHKLESVAGHFIWRCLEIAGVDRWDQLAGMTIRVKAEHTGVQAIGHIVKDDWFNPSQDFKGLGQGPEAKIAELQERLEDAQAQIAIWENKNCCLQATLEENAALKRHNQEGTEIIRRLEAMLAEAKADFGDVHAKWSECYSRLAAIDAAKGEIPPMPEWIDQRGVMLTGLVVNYADLLRNMLASAKAELAAIDQAHSEASLTLPGPIEFMEDDGTKRILEWDWKLPPNDNVWESSPDGKWGEAMDKAHAEGALAEQKQLAPFLRHQGFCLGYTEFDGITAMRICSCGLREALAPGQEVSRA